MTAVLLPCGFSDLAPFARMAAKERVSLKDSRDTRWYWIAPAPSAPHVGFAGLYFHNGVGRVKSVLVFQQHRGRGYGEAAVIALERIAEQDGCSAVEAFAWNRAFYERRGYTCTAKNAHGAYRMMKRL